jgi:hypothetical protein
VTVSDDAGHEAADTLSHVCTTCVAAAALAGAAPLPLFSAPAGHAAADTLLPFAAAIRCGAVVAFYRARAPPSIL